MKQVLLFDFLEEITKYFTNSYKRSCLKPNFNMYAKMYIQYKMFG